MSTQGEPYYYKLKLISKDNLRNRIIPLTETRVFTQRHVQPLTSDIEFVTGRFSKHRFHWLLDVASEANDWIKHTFHGLGRKHLQVYLDEFCYRLNLSIQHVPIFAHLTRLCITTLPVSYFYVTRIA
ncbi:ISXO2-like transposase domain protein [compost metagenome]